MKKIIIVFTAIVFFVGVHSCKKKENNENSSAARSNAIIENAFDEMTNMSDQAVNGSLIFYNLPKVTVLYSSKEEVNFYEKVDCNVIITIDTLLTTKSVTIDWGPSNCDCNDGKQRRGKIISTFTGKYRDSGTVITHTPVEYYVNNNKIEGTKTVTNMGKNSFGQPFYNITVNGTVTMIDGEVFTYNSNRVRTWTSGYTSLLNFLDDEYDITGSADASSTNGNSYVALITSPLHIKVGCAFIVSGTLEFTPSGKALRTIDYGSGSCDNTFTVTINGKTYTING
jgi:hypothetical protein